MSCDIKCDNCEIRKNVARMFDLHWLCRCDCGTEVAILGIKLRSGNTRSCGCLREMSREDRQRLGFPTYKELEKMRRSGA